MFDIKKTAEELDRFVHEIVVKHGLFVQVKKTLVRYKNYAIIKNNDGDWVVLLLKDSKKIHIATTLLKVSAFAVCKLHEKQMIAMLASVKKDDEIFRKNYIDSMFYKKTAQGSQPDKREIAMYRFEIAHAEAKAAKERIDRAFYSSFA